MLAPLVALAFGLVVSGLTTPNPTIVGAERLFDRPDCVRGVLRVTRNPFLWGAATWAVVDDRDGRRLRRARLGGVAALGIAGSVVLDRKKARRHPTAWRRFKQRTSNVPFAAIAGGRQRLALGEIGWWQLAIAAVAVRRRARGARAGVRSFPGAMNMEGTMTARENVEVIREVFRAIETRAHGHGRDAEIATLDACVAQGGDPAACRAAVYAPRARTPDHRRASDRRPTALSHRVLQVQS